MPVHGGRIDRFDEFLSSAIRNKPDGISDDIVKRLVYMYGSTYLDILKYLASGIDMGQTISPGSRVLRAEIPYAIREEMAEKLSDVVFRRTDMGFTDGPGEGALEACAVIMAKEMGWEDNRVQREIEEVKKFILMRGAQSLVTH